MVIGAFGKAGSRIINEAVNRGHEVIGVAHRKHENRSDKNIVIKDVMELNKFDISGIDAIVDAVGAWTPKTQEVHYIGLTHIMNLIKGTNIHYLKIGGSNTLYIDSKHEHTLQELPLYYPEYMQDLCDAHAEGKRILSTYTSINWTYVVPAYNFDPFGKKTGNYKVEGEEFRPAHSLNPNDGKHDYVSYSDYSKAIVDIVEQKGFIRQRITIVSGDNPNPTQRY